MNETKAQTEAHYHDADCRPYIDANDECRVCHVYHGDPCYSCDGRGFHSDRCSTHDDHTTSIDYRGETEDEWLKSQ